MGFSRSSSTRNAIEIDSPAQMALVGFSQGTMMSLFVAPRRAVAPAAVVGYSGALIGPQEVAKEIRSRRPIAGVDF